MENGNAIVECAERGSRQTKNPSGRTRFRGTATTNTRKPLCLFRKKSTTQHCRCLPQPSRSRDLGLRKVTVLRTQNGCGMGVLLAIQTRKVQSSVCMRLQP